MGLKFQCSRPFPGKLTFFSFQVEIVELGCLGTGAASHRANKEQYQQSQHQHHRLLLDTTMSESARPTGCFVEHLHLFQFCLLVARNHHLGNAFTIIDKEIVLRQVD